MTKIKPTYEELVIALDAAIKTYQYASMTSWERDYCKEEMELAEETYNRIPATEQIHD